MHFVHFVYRIETGGEPNNVQAVRILVLGTVAVCLTLIRACQAGRLVGLGWQAA